MMVRDTVCLQNILPDIHCDLNFFYIFSFQLIQVLKYVINCIVSVTVKVDCFEVWILKESFLEITNDT